MSKVGNIVHTYHDKSGKPDIENILKNLDKVDFSKQKSNKSRKNRLRNEIKPKEKRGGTKGRANTAKR